MDLFFIVILQNEFGDNSFHAFPCLQPTPGLRPSQVELSQAHNQMLSTQHEAEAAHEFALRKQLWGSGIATVFLRGKKLFLLP